jgi:hypothetical protein
MELQFFNPLHCEGHPVRDIPAGIEGQCVFARGASRPRSLSDEAAEHGTIDAMSFASFLRYQRSPDLSNRAERIASSGPLHIVRGKLDGMATTYSAREKMHAR